jgi:hypothetical protein
MATGTVKWFNQGLMDLGNKVHNLSSDDIRIGIVTTSTVPTSATAAPHWGGTGTTNFASSQVNTSGSVYTGPQVLSNKSYTLVSGIPTLRADILSLPQDVSGFTNGAYGIIYNNTDTNKRALGFVEFSSSGTISLVTGSLTVDWANGTNDILTLTAV